VASRQFRVALLWRDVPTVRQAATLDTGRFAAAAAAMRAAGLAVEPCVYAEEVEAEVEAQLGAVDAALAWINPIHEGRNRTRLDALLRRVANLGVMVSAHPDTILAMGTKEAVYRTRTMSWGCDVRLYGDWDALRRELPRRLADGAKLVLKQNRGHSGQGVWQIERDRRDEPADLDMQVRVRHALSGSLEETLSLGAFLERCRGYFDGAGLMIEQPYIARLPEGMIRCYLVGQRIQGFGHQAIVSLHPPPPGASADAAPKPGPRLYSGPDDPRFQRLRGLMEETWLPEMMRIVGVDASALPILWDADFLLGPRTAEGEDTYVLCEINVSSIYPFPESALVPLAMETVERLQRRIGQTGG